MENVNVLEHLNNLYGVDVSDCATPEEKLEKLTAYFHMQQDAYTKKYGEMGVEEAKELLYKAVSTRAKKIENPQVREELKLHVINAVKVIVCDQMGIDPNRVGISIIDRSDDFESGRNYGITCPAHIVNYERKFGEKDDPEKMLASVVIYKDRLKMLQAPELMSLMFHEFRHIQQIEMEKQGVKFEHHSRGIHALDWLSDEKEADADRYAYAQSMNIFAGAAHAGYDTNYLRTHKRITSFVFGVYNNAHSLFAGSRHAQQIQRNSEPSK